MRSGGKLLLALGACLISIGWSGQTTRHVAWSAVDFFPSDLERQVRRHHRRFDAGIQRGLEAPPSWRAAAPGKLHDALKTQVEHCAKALRKPVPLDELVEELGYLSVLVLDANDPLAVVHSDPKEPHYADAYRRYADSILSRVRLVYYGQDRDLILRNGTEGTLQRALDRSRALYPFIEAEFYRTGSIRNWRDFDDRSIAFGVAAVSLSRAMTDVANYSIYVWARGGGAVPTPRPTPMGHSGPTVQIALGGGFPENQKEKRGAPVMPKSNLRLPPP